MDSITGASSMMTPYSMNNQSAQNMIKRKDTNGDKSLTADEFGGSLEVFNRIDKNSDGKIDLTELNRSGISKFLDQHTSSLISSLDKNGDNVLSADELKISADTFSKIDTNGDGSADRNELNNYYIANHAAGQYQQTMNSTNSTASPISSSNIIA
jgi:Ca2+-binding EF-hand superfamily protein